MTKYHYFITTVLLALSAHASAVELDMDKMNLIVQKNLHFLSQEQFAEKSGFYEKGEWPAYMRSYLIPSLVGLGSPFSQPTQEPTAFVTSTIVNLLSEAYLLNPKLQAIPSIIEKAVPSLEIYREGDVYHYYPPIEFKGMRIHAPKDPDYVPRKMLALALVPPDADTTSVSFTALAYADLVQNRKPISEFRVPEGTLKALNDFRDVNRSPHPYNRSFGMKDTGAYLTWLWDEKAESSSFFKSMSDKPNKGYRIVFGRNDVDCVVNANVLRLLTLTNNQAQEGYANSCELLNSVILKEKTKFCGVYYPNTFIPLYTISNAYKAGASCLNKSRNEAINFILNRQNGDGSWTNDEGIGREDRVQSTALALNALFNYVDKNKDKDVPNLDSAVKQAVRFLLSQAKTKSGDQTYWPGEVFFSGSAMARNTLLWRSDAYTTSLVLLSLIKAEIYLKNEVSR